MTIDDLIYLRYMLKPFSKRDREIYWMKEFGGYKQKEIASKYSLTQAGISKILEKIKKIIK